MVEGGAFYNQGNQQQHGRSLTYRKKEAQTFDSERFCWRVRAVVSHNTPFNWPFLFLFFIVPYWYWVRLMFFVSRFPVFLFILRLLAIACGCCCGGAYRGGGRHPHLQPSTGWEKTTWPPPTWSGWKELRITLCLTVLLKTDTEVIWSTPKSVSQLHFQWSSFRCVSFPNWSKVVSTNCRKCSFFSLPWTLSHPKHPESGLPYQFRSTNVAL